MRFHQFISYHQISIAVYIGMVETMQIYVWSKNIFLHPRSTVNLNDTFTTVNTEWSKSRLSKPLCIFSASWTFIEFFSFPAWNNCRITVAYVYFINKNLFFHKNVRKRLEECIVLHSYLNICFSNWNSYAVCGSLEF